MATETALTTHQSADNALIAMIATAARDESINVDKLQKLLEMRNQILAKEAEIEFNRCMTAAQAAMAPIVKDAQNPHAHSRYATLEQVDRAIRPIYTEHGFCLTFGTSEPRNPNAVRVVCELRHREGHMKTYELEGELDTSGAQGKSNKTSIQGLGSSTSYLRRYLTLMIFNLVLTSEDNDGNGNREAYNAMRHAADARQAARQAAEQAVPGEPVYEPVPEDTLERDLAASIVQAQSKKKPKKELTKFQILDLFKEMKQKYIKIGGRDSYYTVLGLYGMEHANDFSDDALGRAKARSAYKHMQLNIADLEAHLNKQAEEAADGH